MLILEPSAASAIACGTDRGIALKLLLLQGDKVISSTLIQIDLMDAMARFMRMRAASRKVVDECIELTLDLIDELVPFEDFAAEAFSEAAQRKIPMGKLVYYCMARRYGATLVTTDEELWSLCLASGVPCTNGNDADFPMKKVPGL